ncbi:UreF protein [Sphaeroforma arctica JP610]|uniref:UreF protein n=1 Tax=Sphaeroforma arctica JP610 TaxID=667725 RepID=A0A0L0GEP0_9EUKA|nr:UreF protein [Sphaeroforma arctica JP610]KNC87485.1 UreF protein [Sphaeroforma arctica JP610]|eukprot:XP_014161387.1 UreF protein [Sphaeroforma arctica JP610]
MQSGSSWVLWQLIDSAFPSGGFAHSGGLEAASQYGLTPTYTQLSGAVTTAVQQVASQSLPIMHQVHTNPESVWEADHFLDCSLTNNVANKASRSQGEALLSSAIDCFPTDSETSQCAYLSQMKAEGRARRRHNARNKNEPNQPVYFHFAVIFAAVCRELKIPVDDMCDAFLFISLRGLTGAAVRLGLIGPIQAQRLQFQLTPATSAMSSHYIAQRLQDSASTDPILDLVHSNHDSLFFKLFIS